MCGGKVADKGHPSIPLIFRLAYAGLIDVLNLGKILLRVDEHNPPPFQVYAHISW